VPTLGRICASPRQTSLDEGQQALCRRDPLAPKTGASAHAPPASSGDAHITFASGFRTAPGRSLDTNGLVFPDLNADGEALQTNLIMPEPTIFLERKFPIVSIIRPTQTKGAAMGALKALTADGLFIGQSPEFFTILTDLAKAADAAKHGS
jgi:hypothetical protein